MSKWKWIGIVLMAGALGWFVSMRYFDGQSPIARTEVGQKAIQSDLSARAPDAPAGLSVASEGQVIPSLTLKDLEGRSQELRALAGGKPMLINFWATWCGPCIAEIPELVAFSSSQSEVVVVGIALDEVPAAQGFVTRFGMKYAQLVDSIGPADSSVVLGNSAGVLPYSVLIDSQGRLVKKKVGPFHSGDIEKFVKARK